MKTEVKNYTHGEFVFGLDEDEKLLLRFSVTIHAQTTWEKTHEAVPTYFLEEEDAIRYGTRSLKKKRDECRVKWGTPQRVWMTVDRVYLITNDKG